MTATDLSWLDHPWPTFWLADTDALSSPAPAPEAESTPIYEAAMAAHLAAGLDWSEPTYRTEPAETWGDDRPGMMRVHIAQERALALCDRYTRNQLRSIARGKGVRGRFPTKRDLAVALALAGVKA